ncbi:MAG: NAD-dependent epimerase/dehydratase family protein [Pseudomonadota bacterium]
MSHTLIAGAGFTGRRIAQSLIDAGQTVTVASRTPPAIAGATPLVLDVDRPDSLETLSDRLRAPVDDLVYLIPPDRTAADASDLDQRLNGVLHAASEKLNRVVLASTTGVYGDHAGGIVTEHTPLAPITARAKARVGAEKTLARFATIHDVRHTILRISGIYGPDRLMLDGIEARRPILQPEDAGPGNRIHVEDLAMAFVRVLQSDPMPDVINVADGNDMSPTDFALKVAELAALDPPPLVDRQTATATFSPMRLSFLNESRRIQPERLLALLGNQMRYGDPVAGIRASLKAMGRLAVG